MEEWRCCQEAVCHSKKSFSRAVTKERDMVNVFEVTS